MNARLDTIPWLTATLDLQGCMSRRARCRLRFVHAMGNGPACWKVHTWRTGHGFWLPSSIKSIWGIQPPEHWRTLKKTVNKHVGESVWRMKDWAQHSRDQNIELRGRFWVQSPSYKSIVLSTQRRERKIRRRELAIKWRRAAISGRPPNRFSIKDRSSRPRRIWFSLPVTSNLISMFPFWSLPSVYLSVKFLRLILRLYQCFWGSQFGTQLPLPPCSKSNLSCRCSISTMIGSSETM